MTMIAGYETEIEAPALARRPRALLADAALPLFDTNGRIEAGVHFCPIGCSGLDSWIDSTCAEVDIPDSNPDTELASFVSFLASASEVSPARYDEGWIASRIRSRIDVMYSAAVAAEVQTGAITDNPSLQHNASHVVASSVPIATGMFAIEDILADFDNAQFFIHMDPATFYLVASNEDVQYEAGLYFTPSGHIIVADAGFDGTLPPDDPDTGNPLTTDADGRWIYASLPVYGWTGPARTLGGETGRLDMTRNTRTDIAVKPALAVFDPCVVAAVQVDVPTYTVDTA